MGMRVFSEQEIGAILKRTAELAKQVHEPNTDGLVLEEIQELAAEAGLDPDLVARAAVELAAGPAPRQKRDVFGGPMSYATDVDLGVDVDPDSWESMLPAIRTYFDDPGTVATREGVFEWTVSGGDADKKAHVYVRKTPSGSRLHVYWSQTAMAIPFYIPVMLAFMFSIPILFQDLNLGVVGIPVMALVLGSFFMLSRFGVTSMRNRKAGKIDKLASDLSRIAYEGHMARSAVVVDGAVRSDERTEAPETRPADRKIPGLDESVSSEPPANEVGTAEGRSRRRQ